MIKTRIGYIDYTIFGETRKVKATFIDRGLGFTVSKVPMWVDEEDITWLEHPNYKDFSFWAVTRKDWMLSKVLVPKFKTREEFIKEDSDEDGRYVGLDALESMQILKKKNTHILYGSDCSSVITEALYLELLKLSDAYYDTEYADYKREYKDKYETDSRYRS